VTQKISAGFTSFLFAPQAKLQYLSLSFFRLNWGKTADKLTINWPNFAQVGLQLEFAFRIRPLMNVIQLFLAKAT